MLEPGFLVCGGNDLICADLLAQVIVRLCKGLPRDLIFEHDRRGIEVDVVQEVAGIPANVANFEQHIAAHLSLDREVHHMIATDLEVGVIGEAQDFRKGTGRNDRDSLLSERCWSRNASINADSEDRAPGSPVNSATSPR